MPVHPAGYRQAVVDGTGDPMSNTWRYRDEAWSETGTLVGYDVEATDGSIGEIDEATSETDRSYVVVDTGSWISGEKRLIPAGLVTGVDHDARTVTVTLSKDQIRAAPKYDGASADEAMEIKHGDYYGPFSW
jgi:hypothetical protein